MVTGKFENGDRPMVPAVIAWNQSFQTPNFILDTGFTGDLLVTQEIANSLGLKVNGVTPAKNANGTMVNLPSATAFAFMEGLTVYVTVLISDSMPLLGIGFLEKFKCRATVDCKYKTVTLDVPDSQ